MLHSHNLVRGLKTTLKLFRLCGSTYGFFLLSLSPPHTSHLPTKSSTPGAWVAPVVPSLGRCSAVQCPASRPVWLARLFGEPCDESHH